jgi:hypothetical protein
MQLQDLDQPITKTVWIRRNGVLKAVKIPVEDLPAMKPHPMFPIERKRDGHE